MRIVETRGVKLATESFGSPDKGTILLVMGATASMVWWPLSFCQALAAGGYQVIRFDLRDTGQSTTGQPGKVDYDVTELAHDLLAILNAYDARSAHVVGMSLGGMLIQIVALTQPDRVQTLTLIASEPVGMTYEAEGMSEDFIAHFATMEHLDWSDRTAVAAFMFRIAELSAGSAPPFDAGSARARIAKELDRTANIQSAFNHAQLAGKLDPALTAAGITQPVLVIHGTEDPIIAFAAAETLVAAIPDADLLTLDRRGHDLPLQDLPRIGDAILNFLAG